MNIYISDKKYKTVGLLVLASLTITSTGSSLLSDTLDTTFLIFLTSIMIGFEIGIGFSMIVIRWISLHQESKRIGQNNLEKLNQMSGIR